MKKFFIEALGCALREIDAERIKNWLTANGLKFTLSSGDADYIFFVSSKINKTQETLVSSADMTNNDFSSIIASTCFW